MAKRRSDEATKRRRGRGFSFVEILFAIFILGIGFIMIAAIFPVAIQQTQTTVDDAMARGVAEGAVKQVEAVFNRFNPPPTGGKVEFNRDALKYLHGSRVVSGDARYAWVPMYSYTLNPGSKTQNVEVWIVVTRSRNKPEYNEADYKALEPVKGAVDLLNTGSVDRAVFNGGATDPALNAAAEGAFVIREDGTASYRLGRLLDQTATRKEFEIVPGDDSKDVTASGTVSALVVGRGLAEPVNYSSANLQDELRDGPAQDLYLIRRIVTVTLP